MKPIRINGMLCDDRVHMTAREYCEHKNNEDYYKHGQALRKLSGNPILTEEARKEIWYASLVYDENIRLRNYLAETMEINRTMKKALYGNIYERQEANKKLKTMNAQKLKARNKNESV